MFGRTTNSLRKNLGWARKAIVSFSYAPLDLITGLALFVVGISLIALARRGRSCASPIPHSAPKGFTTVIVVDPVHRRHPAPLPGDHRLLPRPHVRRGQAPSVRSSSNRSSIRRRTRRSRPGAIVGGRPMSRSELSGEPSVTRSERHRTASRPSTGICSRRAARSAAHR